MWLTVDGHDVPEVHVELTRSRAERLAELLLEAAAGGTTDFVFKTSVRGHQAKLEVTIDEWARQDPDGPPSS